MARSTPYLAHSLFLAWLVLFVLAGDGICQPTGHEIVGSVYDSVGHTWLAGVVVQAVRTDSSAVPSSRAYTAISDGRGEFVIRNLMSGHYAVGFQHDAVAAREIESPLIGVDLSHTAQVRVALAIPSARAIRAAVCALDSVGTSSGLLAGRLHAAGTGEAIGKARVTGRWSELALTLKEGKTVESVRTIDAGADGTFRLCGIHSGSPVLIEVEAPGYRMIRGELEVPLGSALWRDLWLVDTNTQVGNAKLIGSVSTADGSAVASGRILVPELAAEADIINGKFHLTGLPAGSWEVLVRAIGYQPVDMIVDMTNEAPLISIPVAKRAQQLDEWRILATKDRSARRLESIQDLKRVGFGTFVVRGDRALETARDVKDVLATAPGFHLDNQGGLEGRVIAGKSFQRCRPTWYVDGVRNGPMVPIEDILAIAGFPDIAGVPSQWRVLGTCAVIAVWTK